MDDLETVVRALVLSHDERVRASSAAVLAGVGARLPAMFVKHSLEGLLRDEHAEVRRQAIEAIADLEPAGLDALARVLDEPAAAHRIVEQLASPLVRVGAGASRLLPRLLALQRQTPESASILRAISVVGADAPEVLAVMEPRLASSEPAIRDAARDALSRRHVFFSRSSPLYNAALIEAESRTELETRIGTVLERIRPHFGPSTLMLHLPVPSHFSWPPAQPLFTESIAIQRLGAPSAKRGAVSREMLQALRHADWSIPRSTTSRRASSSLSASNESARTANRSPGANAGLPGSVASYRSTAPCWT